MTDAPADSPLLRRLALFIVRRRRLVIAVWLVLTIVGVVASGQLSSRWYQSSAVPGGPAYEGGQRALAAFGTGARAPDVVVERHRLDAERLRQTAHAQRLDAGLVGERERGVQHPRPAQRDAGCVAGCGSGSGQRFDRLRRGQPTRRA